MNEAEMKEKLAELYNCRTCKFVHYNPKDVNEYERCSRLKDSATINWEIGEIIAKYNLKNVCEYWGSKE